MTMRAERLQIVGGHAHGRDKVPGTISFAGLPRHELLPLRRGAYVRASDWDDVFGEARLRTRADAVGRRCQDDQAAFSRMTAAALWRLPVYRSRSDRVDMIFPHRYTRRNSADVVRHQEPLPRNDIVEIDGHRVTSLERTVYDAIRLSSIEAGTVVYDAALRLCAWDEDALTYDTTVAEAFRGLVDHRIRRGTGARGIRQARFISEIADGRAQLPGETVSRLWLLQLGVPAPQLQYRVDFEDGTFALLDMAWPALGRWMEFDGLVKYEDPAFMKGRAVDEVLADQRMRERRVRELTGWRCDRHGFDRMPTIDDFADYLRSVGLR